MEGGLGEGVRRRRWAVVRPIMPALVGVSKEAGKTLKG